jgi:hypothetical protein
VTVAVVQRGCRRRSASRARKIGRWAVKS